MAGIFRVGMLLVSGGAMLCLAGCSRTSDGTIVVPQTPRLPGFDMEAGEKLVPAFMKKPKTPEPAGVNFPPPPETETPKPRRKAMPPVVATKSGNLACSNVSDGGRVRMVCK